MAESSTTGGEREIWKYNKNEYINTCYVYDDLGDTVEEPTQNETPAITIPPEQNIKLMNSTEFNNDMVALTDNFFFNHSIVGITY